MIQTYNEYHLGDNLIHLNYLRRLSYTTDEPMVHHCNTALHRQLLPVIADTAITLADLYIPPNTVNAWIGANNYYYNSPRQADWVQFHLDWFDHLSNILGVSSPIACREDLLFEYPLLNEPLYAEFDYLIINAAPASNQLPKYTPEFFNNRVRDLLNAGHTVITTNPTGMCTSTLEMQMDVTRIGALSKGCKFIEGVATGPMWTTFNVFNLDTVKRRTFYCAHQTVNLTNNTITKNL